MRTWAAIGFGVCVACMLGARFLPHPTWMYALALLPVALPSFVLGTAMALFEVLLGPRIVLIAPIVGAATSLFPLLYSVLEAPPGTLDEGLPLEHLGPKLVSLGALGVAFSSFVLGAFGLRSSSRPGQLVGALAIGAAALALSPTLRGLGLGFANRPAIALIAASLLLFLLSQKKPPGPAEPRPPDEPSV